MTHVVCVCVTVNIMASATCKQQLFLVGLRYVLYVQTVTAKYAELIFEEESADQYPFKHEFCTIS